MQGQTVQGQTVQGQTVQNIGMEGINLLGIVQRKRRILDLDVRDSNNKRSWKLKHNVCMEGVVDV